MAEKETKKQTAMNPHPKGKGREHVEQSHDLKKAISKSPKVPRHFAHSALGNR